MRVLVACEYSAIVRDAFRRRGHDAWSCDFLDTEGDPQWHIKGDTLEILNDGWDLMIAHPPCTFLCNSGVRWLHERPERWIEMKEAAEFFKLLLNADIPRIAIENPVMHKYAVKIIGRRQDFTVQPWQFGDNFKKRTCFWAKNLPPLKPTSDLDGSTAIAECHLASPGENRWKDRSRTYPGLANAMADQWEI